MRRIVALSVFSLCLKLSASFPSGIEHNNEHLHVYSDKEYQNTEFNHETEIENNNFAQNIGFNHNNNNYEQFKPQLEENGQLSGDHNQQRILEVNRQTSHQINNGQLLQIPRLNLENKLANHENVNWQSTSHTQNSQNNIIAQSNQDQYTTNVLLKNSNTQKQIIDKFVMVPQRQIYEQAQENKLQQLLSQRNIENIQSAEFVRNDGFNEDSVYSQFKQNQFNEAIQDKETVQHNIGQVQKNDPAETEIHTYHSELQAPHTNIAQVHSTNTVQHETVNEKPVSHKIVVQQQFNPNDEALSEPNHVNVQYQDIVSVSEMRNSDKKEHKIINKSVPRLVLPVTKQAASEYSNRLLLDQRNFENVGRVYNSNYVNGEMVHERPAISESIVEQSYVNQYLPNVEVLKKNQIIPQSQETSVESTSLGQHVEVNYESEQFRPLKYYGRPAEGLNNPMVSANSEQVIVTRNENVIAPPERMVGEVKIIQQPYLIPVPETISFLGNAKSSIISTDVENTFEATSVPNTVASSTICTTAGHISAFKSPVTTAPVPPKPISIKSSRITNTSTLTEPTKENNNLSNSQLSNSEVNNIQDLTNVICAVVKSALKGIKLNLLSNADIQNQHLPHTVITRTLFNNGSSTTSNSLTTNFSSMSSQYNNSLSTITSTVSTSETNRYLSTPSSDMASSYNVVTEKSKLFTPTNSFSRGSLYTSTISSTSEVNTLSSQNITLNGSKIFTTTITNVTNGKPTKFNTTKNRYFSSKDFISRNSRSSPNPITSEKNYFSENVSPSTTTTASSEISSTAQYNTFFTTSNLSSKDSLLITSLTNAVNTLLSKDISSNENKTSRSAVKKSNDDITSESNITQNSDSLSERNSSKGSISYNWPSTNNATSTRVTTSKNNILPQNGSSSSSTTNYSASFEAYSIQSTTTSSNEVIPLFSNNSSSNVSETSTHNISLLSNSISGSLNGSNFDSPSFTYGSFITTTKYNENTGSSPTQNRSSSWSSKSGKDTETVTFKNWLPTLNYSADNSSSHENESSLIHRITSNNESLSSTSSYSSFSSESTPGNNSSTENAKSLHNNFKEKSPELTDFSSSSTNFSSNISSFNNSPTLNQKFFHKI